MAETGVQGITKIESNDSGKTFFLKKGRQMQVITQKEIDEIVNFLEKKGINNSTLSTNIEKSSSDGIKDIVHFEDKYFENVDFSSIKLPISLTIGYAKDISLSYFFRNCSFENCTFSKSEVLKGRFQNCEIKNTNFEDIQIVRGLGFLNTNFESVSFKNSKFVVGRMGGATVSFSECSFEDVKFDLADLGGLSFERTEFKVVSFIGSENVPELNPYQKENAYFSESEKKKLEKIEIADEKIEDIGEEQTKKLLNGFIKAKDDFQQEEKKWLLFAGISFFWLVAIASIFFLDFLGFYNSKQIFISLFIFIFFAFISAFYMLLYKKGLSKDTVSNWKYKIKNAYFMLSMASFFASFGVLYQLYKSMIPNISLSEKNNIVSLFVDKFFHTTNYYDILPFSLLFVSLLYFCVYQYAKAKRLGIENQNKISLIHAYQALKAESDAKEKYQYFLPKFSEIIFSPVFPQKGDKNLPIDEVASLIRVIKTSK